MTKTARVIAKILLFPKVVFLGLVGWALVWLSESLNLKKKMRAEH